MPKQLGPKPASLLYYLISSKHVLLLSVVAVTGVQAVNGLTINVRKMFLEMDAQLYEECQAAFLEEEAKAKEVEEHRETTWKRLEVAGQGKSTSVAAAAPAGAEAAAGATAPAPPAAPAAAEAETAVVG